MKRKPIEEEINLFLEDFGLNELIRFFEDVYPLFHLYDITDEEDWMRAHIEEEEITTVRSIRTVYLLSKLAEFQAGKLCSLKVKYPDLWKRMEKHDEKKT